jgi:RNA polymerase sigma-70 factor (ECF subfamily)
VEDLNEAERVRWERVRVERARTGDRTAFTDLYRAYAGAIFARVLLPKLGDRAAAEDALSETFRTAFERLSTYEDRGVSVYHWIARIAKNKALDMHRARGATGRAITSFEELVAPLAEAPPGADELYELRVDQLKIEGAVKEVLGRLNPRYRRAIELRFGEERSREECAAALDVKLGTFDVLVLRALRAFRKEWSETVSRESVDESG